MHQHKNNQRLILKNQKSQSGLRLCNNQYSLIMRIFLLNAPNYYFFHYFLQNLILIVRRTQRNDIFRLDWFNKPRVNLPGERFQQRHKNERANEQEEYWFYWSQNPVFSVVSLLFFWLQDSTVEISLRSHQNMKEVRMWNQWVFTKETVRHFCSEVGVVTEKLRC